MTLFEFLDVTYRDLNFSLQKEFTIPQEGRLKASYALIQWQRWFFKTLWMPLLLLQYVLVNLHLRQKPSMKDPVIVAPLENVETGGTASTVN